MKKFKNNYGFTIIELFVVMAIISILSSVVFFNWRSGEASFALQNSAYRLSQDIREMQEMAMEAIEIDCGGGEIGSSFGIRFKKSYANYYELGVDCNGNKVFEANDILRKVYFEEGIEIFDLSPNASFSLIFEPPEPTTYIKGETSGTEAVIEIYNPEYSSRKKTIRVNTSGMIEVK